MQSGCKKLFVKGGGRMIDLQMERTSEQHAAIMSWNIVSRICGAKHMKNIVLAFGDNVRSQKALERLTKINVSHINRNLKKLSKFGVVHCLTPPEVSRVKFYALTTFGHSIAEWVTELEKENPARSKFRNFSIEENLLYNKR